MYGRKKISAESFLLANKLYEMENERRGRLEKKEFALLLSVIPNFNFLLTTLFGH